MKKLLATTLVLALAAPALAVVFLRDPVVEVTATTTATATDLAGTQTEWNFVTVHNHGSVRVRITSISNDDDGSGMTNYTTGKIEIPAGGAVEIVNEPVQQIKHATESDTADLVIERGKRIL
jgi:copper(I)-binding protein